MKRRSQQWRVQTPGLLSRMVGAVCGRAQRLITAGPSLPLVLATYPRQNSWLAVELSSVLRFTFPALTEEVKRSYRDALARVPTVIVAELRLANVCSCLGHHHPEVTHSLLTKSLQADTGGTVGEIDLAVGSIREWNPLPLAGLAAAASDSAARAAMGLDQNSRVLALSTEGATDPEIYQRMVGRSAEAVLTNRRP